MALHFTREAWELIQFRLPDTGKLVHIEARFIRWVAKLVRPGERHAITVTAALKAMNVTDTDRHRRQWRHAVDFWQMEGVAVAATTSGYFTLETEEERQRSAAFKQTTIEGLQRRQSRILGMTLGTRFPEVP